MARPRVIKQDDILDAAEAVVVRCGAAHLTLDAVAVEAGISKASVSRILSGTKKSASEGKPLDERGASLWLPCSDLWP